MKWLEVHMRNRMAAEPCSEDIELLDEAAEAVRQAELRAAETETRAQSMVTHAQAELKIAERLLQDSEIARAEAETKERKARVKLNEAVKAAELKTEQALEELSKGEHRVKLAEERAQELEDQLKTLRAALRSRFGKESRSGNSPCEPGSISTRRSVRAGR